jgi:DNA polymerase-3 subunit beta
MKFVISRESLLKPLNLVAGVVERRQTLPILSNVMLVLEGKQLSITGTDLEVELVGRVDLEQAPDSGGEITVPARKLADICKSLPDGSDILFSLEDQRLIIKSGRSRFILSSLSASDFPNVEEGPGNQGFSVKQGVLKRLIDRTSFAMAQQDVRYYLNGMLWEIRSGQLRLVATDGHRLAVCTLPADIVTEDNLQVILPRKGVIELARLLMNEDENVEIVIGTNHIRATTTEFTFTSKLVDGKFPDYDRVLPKSSTKAIFGSRDELRQAFTRTSILSNEKYRGVRLLLSDNSIQIVANNPEQEEAEETVSVDYQGETLEIGFNVSYLLDVLGVLSGDQVKISLSDSNSSALLEESEESDSMYVVMPMRL